MLSYYKSDMWLDNALEEKLHITVFICFFSCKLINIFCTILTGLPTHSKANMYQVNFWITLDWMNAEIKYIVIVMQFTEQHSNHKLVSGN